MEQALKSYFSHDRFAALTGAEIIEAGPGFCRCRMVVEDKHLNAAGTVQGGAIFTLADFTFAVASNSRGQLAVAVNVNISFLKAIRSGVIYATATEVTEPHRLGSYLVHITDENGDMLAIFSGMVYRKRETIEGLQI